MHCTLLISENAAQFCSFGNILLDGNILFALQNSAFAGGFCRPKPTPIIIIPPLSHSLLQVFSPKLEVLCLFVCHCTSVHAGTRSSNQCQTQTLSALALTVQPRNLGHNCGAEPGAAASSAC